MTNKTHNTADITSSEIDVPELQENEFAASKRTVTNRRVAAKREIVPPKSSLAREAEENFSRMVGAMYDVLP